jgi:hypothetical protein
MNSLVLIKTNKNPCYLLKPLKICCIFVNLFICSRCIFNTPFLADFIIYLDIFIKYLDIFRAVVQVFGLFSVIYCLGFLIYILTLLYVGVGAGLSYISLQLDSFFSNLNLVSELDWSFDGVISSSGFDPVRDAALSNIAAESSGSTGGGSLGGGSSLPPLDKSVVSPPQEDLLTIKCRNQLNYHGRDRQAICSQTLPPECRLDTEDLRRELCSRYYNSGSPGGYQIRYLERGDYVGEPRIYRTGTNPAKMDARIFNAIAR